MNWLTRKLKLRAVIVKMSAFRHRIRYWLALTGWLPNSRLSTHMISQMSASVAADDSDRPIHFDIQDKELELVRLVAEGLNNKEIAARIFLSEGTVRNQLSVILEKLGLRDRTQLAIYYYKNWHSRISP